MSFSEAQLEARRSGIGGSEIASICGESAYGSAFDVWLSKVEGYRKPESEDLLRGKFLESAIGEWYAHRKNLEPCDLVRPLLTSHGFVHNLSPIAFCNPDFFELGEKCRLVSIKAPRHFRSTNQDGAARWGEDGSSHVPVEYQLQLQWEFMVLESLGEPLDPLMRLAAMGEGELRVFDVLADRELQASLLQVATVWWRRHIVEGVRPELEATSDTKNWIRSKFPRDTQPVRKATFEEERLMIELQSVAASRAATEELYEIYQRQIEERIGVAGGIEGAPGTITFRANKNGTRVFKPQWRSA
jgi:predicted phage-related endonuclease